MAEQCFRVLAPGHPSNSVHNMAICAALVAQAAVGPSFLAAYDVPQRVRTACTLCGCMAVLHGRFTDSCPALCGVHASQKVACCMAARPATLLKGTSMHGPGRCEQIKVLSSSRQAGCLVVPSRKPYQVWHASGALQCGSRIPRTARWACLQRHAARPDCRACVCCQSTGDLQEVSEVSRSCSDGDSHISHTWTDSDPEPGVAEQPGTHRMSSLGLRVLHVQVADVLAEAAKDRVQAMWHASLALVGALLLAEQAAVPGKPHVKLHVSLWLLLLAPIQRCLA